MHSSRITRRRLIAPAAAGALLAAMAWSGQSTAGATTGAPPGSVTGLPRTLTAAATVSFPTGQHIGKPAGYQQPEVFDGVEGATGDVVNRSHSVRPSAASSPHAGSLAPPVVARTPISAAKPGLARSFHGLDLFDQRYANGGNQFSLEPPDQALCVGNGYVLESVNDVLQVYRQDGSAATPVTDLNTFYRYAAQFNRTTGAVGPFVTDPVCLFDKATNRFFITVLTLGVAPNTGAFTGANHLDIAVSRTGNPTGGYKIYRLPVADDGTRGTPKHKDCPCIGDYPHIGADANALFLTTNEYPFSSAPGVYGHNFNGAQIYAFDKYALAAGTDRVRGVQFENTSVSGGGLRFAGFTVWPTQSAGTDFDRSNNGTEHFLSSVAAEEANIGTGPVPGFANRIATWQVGNTGSLRSGSGTPYLARRLVGSNVYGVPPLVAQKVGPVPLRDCVVVDCVGFGGKDPNATEGPLNANDSRMQQTWYAGGKVFGALDTIVRVDGNLQAGIAYYVVDADSSALTNQGYLAVSKQNLTYPAIATLPNGKGVMAFTLVGQDYYPSAAYTTFNPAGTGAVYVAAAGVGPQDGFTEYPFLSGQFRPRWGDYGAAVVDGSKIWIGSEYIGQRCGFAGFQRDITCGGTRGLFGNWGTRISQVNP